MDTAVGLVKSYLGLAGYFVLAELPVRERASEHHRDVTDLDIVAVRFPPQSLGLNRASALACLPSSTRSTKRHGAAIESRS